MLIMSLLYARSLLPQMVGIFALCPFVVAPNIFQSASATVSFLVRICVGIWMCCGRTVAIRYIIGDPAAEPANN